MWDIKMSIQIGNIDVDSLVDRFTSGPSYGVTNWSLDNSLKHLNQTN